MAPLLLRFRVQGPLLRQTRLVSPRAFRRVNSTSTPTTPPPPPAATASSSPPPTPSPAPTSSSSSKGASPESYGVSGLRTALFATSIGVSIFVLYLYGTDTRASAHRWVVPPLMRVVYPDAEEAHHAGTQALKILYRLGLNPRDRTDRDPNQARALAVTVFDEGDPARAAALANPIGISAGLDKDADIPDALFALGAAVVEVGGCTARPQGGNPRPRMFRVPSVDGFVNRCGLNSIGADALAARLQARLRAFCRSHGLTEADVRSGRAGVPAGSLAPGRLLMVQVAKNKDTDEHDVRAVAEDYAYCVRRLAPYADVLVVNVSSPNTPGLRDLQAVEPLTRILDAVVAEAQRSVLSSSSSAGPRAHPPRVMVKVSPDEDEDAQIDGICEAIWASGVDGIIVGNTTKRRAGLVPPALALPPREKTALAETGGFSGPAMFDRTLSLVQRYRKRLDEQALRAGDDAARATEGPEAEATANTAVAAAATPKTLFASGGVTSGQQAQQLLNAGASVAMVYTGLVYGGAGTITRIKQELKEVASPQRVSV